MTTPSDVPSDLDLLDQYLAGTLPVDEVELLRDRLRHDERLRAVHDELLVLSGPTAASSLHDDDVAWERMQADLDRLAPLRPSPIRGLRHTEGKRWQARWAWVGVVVTALVIGVLGQQWWLTRADSTADRVYTAYATRSAQVARMTLPDGTRLTLAPNSTIRLAKDFQAHRDVILDGEAYFDVVRSSGAPFFVHAGGVTTRVLGTQFDVRHYASERATTVGVVSGKVTVGTTMSNRSVLTVTSGTMVVVTDSISRAAIGSVASMTSWTTGALSFEHTPAGDVLAAVGHWYGYEFRIADSSLSRRLLTVRFDGDSPDVVLRSLSTILNATITSDGNILTVSPRLSDAGAARKERIRDTLLHPSMEVGR